MPAVSPSTRTPPPLVHLRPLGTRPCSCRIHTYENWHQYVSLHMDGPTSHRHKRLAGDRGPSLIVQITHHTQRHNRLRRLLYETTRRQRRRDYCTRTIKTEQHYDIISYTLYHTKYTKQLYYHLSTITSKDSPSPPDGRLSNDRVITNKSRALH